MLPIEFKNNAALSRASYNNQQAMNKIFLFLFLIFTTQLSAQEPMTVIRCTAPELQDPIQNIYVDKDNKKWVGNSTGLFQVHAIDFATEEAVKLGDEALLKLPNGNNDLTWSKSEMDNILNGATITAAFYDTKSRELWVGTEDSGIIRLKTKPSLQKVGEVTSKNSKLKSDKINAINKDRDGRFWIGSDEGVLIGTLDKWKLEEKFFTIEAISINRENIWVMGDETVWKVEEDDELYPIDIDERMVDGSIRDIAADSKGRVWIASDVVSRYNFIAESYQLFGPAQYFTSQAVNYVAVDKDDALWVGTEDKGLYLIEKASAITVTVLVDKGLSCDASKPDAALKVRITGGQPPYFYDWDGGLKGENPTNLAAGEYAVTVTDDKGKTKSSKVMIPDPRFTLSAVQDKQESGAGAGDAAATVTISGGGLPEFKYVWDNGETTAQAVKLTEGAHAVTVTDKNGCTALTTLEVSQKLTPLKVTVKQTAENNCQNDANAGLEVLVEGGKSPYKFKWNDTEVEGKTRSGLKFSQYTVTVTDGTGVTTAGSIVIKEILGIMASISVEKSASTGNSDGKAKATAKGSSDNFTYKWDNGETTQTAIKLPPGSHSVTVTDAKGCEQVATTDISENILALSISISQTTKLNCYGDQNAAVSTAINGGKGPFIYNWNIADLVGEKPANLPAGTYEVTLTDVTGATATEKITIEEPKELSATATVQAAATTGNSDGKATVKASGGNGNYTYKWTNNETDKTAKALSPGAHSVTITDAAGCSTTASVDISENILELGLVINQTVEIDCFGNKNAAVEVEMNGGKGPFQYAWSAANLNGEKATNLGAGNYSVTLTDAAGTTKTAQISIQEPKELTASISVQQPASTGKSDGKATVKASGGSGNYTYKWTTNETDKMAKALSPGANSVTITDEAGCSTTVSVDISENILELGLTINQTGEIDCFGNKNAAVEVQVNGGKGPFQYAWSDANSNGERAANLGAGSYSVTLTDAAGTTKTAQISIQEPKELTASISVQQPASTGNSDGKALANISGGDGKYTFKWANGEMEKTASKLSPGKHTLTITDGRGCTITVDTEISENVLPLTVSISEISKLDCYGDKKAALKVTTNGGKAPFTFKWNQSAAKDDSPNKLPAGEYQVTVTDAKGATKAASFTINEPTKLTARITALENTSEQTSNDGEAKVAASGGAGNYTYAWDNGQTSETGRKFNIGKHNVVVKDVKGCEVNVDFEIKKKIIPELRVGRLSIGQVIRLSELYFDADSTILNQDAMPILDEITYFLEQNPTISIEIGGHTNGVPPHEYCDALSDARAKSIATYILGKGIEISRVKYKGYGKRKPIASNKTADGRKRNQRVELTILTL
jgi:outer membrane protein OmpA-like peptidoglycan-associated protein